MRQRNGRKNRAGCGNDGAVETMENQTTVFHRSHRSLEIRRTAPDSHIPTASTTGLFFSSRTRKPSRSSGALRARNPSSQLNNPANGEISPFRIILGLEYALVAVFREPHQKLRYRRNGRRSLSGKKAGGKGPAAESTRRRLRPGFQG